MPYRNPIQMAVNKTILEGIRLLLGYLITITKMPNKKNEKAP